MIENDVNGLIGFSHEREEYLQNDLIHEEEYQEKKLYNHNHPGDKCVLRLDLPFTHHSWSLDLHLTRNSR